MRYEVRRTSYLVPLFFVLRTYLRIHAAHLRHRGDTADGHDVGGGAKVGLVTLRGLEDVFEGLDHLGFEALVDLVLGPEVAMPILDPFEVRGGDATRVGENVRDDEHAALVQMLVRVRRRRA